MIDYIQAEGRSIRKGSATGFKKSYNNLLFIFARAETQDSIKKLFSELKLNFSIYERYKRAPYARSLSISPYAFAMRDYFYESGEIKTGKLLFVVKGNLLLVLSDKDSKYYRKLFDETFEEIKANKVRNVGKIMYNFMLEDVEDNYQVLDKTEKQINEIEVKILNKKVTKHSVQELINLKRRLFQISRQFWASTKIIAAMRTGLANIKLDAESRADLEDIHETFLHQIDVASSQKEILSDVLTMYSTNVSNSLASVGNRLNIITKKLAAWAIIIMIPTLITGYYGMNVHNLPFANHNIGIGVITLIMATSVFLTTYYFSKRNWL